MKQDPALHHIITRMAPCVLCRDGFLGHDPRDLSVILDADRSALVGLGLDHEAIAERLRAIYDKAAATFGAPAAIDERLTAVLHEVKGRIPCPWGGCGTFAKGEVELTDAETHDTLRFTALGLHLIAAHGFYQGRGSRYRLDPDVIARMLRMT